LLIFDLKLISNHFFFNFKCCCQGDDTTILIS